VTWVAAASYLTRSGARERFRKYSGDLYQNAEYKVDKESVEVSSFSYPTTICFPFIRKAPRIQALASSLKTQIDHRYGDYDDITLVCHSLGGVIARAYVLKEIKDKNSLRVGGLVLFAVPNTGTNWPSFDRQAIREALEDGASVELSLMELSHNVPPKTCRARLTALNQQANCCGNT
jgi:pimeloyl-ACP methyl ester carboxylesterase